jgi:hypothetical protein
VWLFGQPRGVPRAQIHRRIGGLRFFRWHRCTLPLRDSHGVHHKSRRLPAGSAKNACGCLPLRFKPCGRATADLGGGT